jgi:hypothetical protein
MRVFMSKLSWKTTFAATVILGATVYAFAQMPSDRPMAAQDQMQHDGMMGHGQMMQAEGSKMERGMHHGKGMQGTMHDRMGDHVGQRSGAPTLSGQDAFGAIQEIVQMLQSDPATDWSKVNIGALRHHLIDMNEVTLHAAATERLTDNTMEIIVTGEGRTLESIKRMVPAHISELRQLGWNAKTEELPNGIKLTVIASETQPLTKLKALGFMGIMVQGSHHQPHHLRLARGELTAH